MNTRSNIKLVSLGTLWLFLLLCNTAMRGLQHTSENYSADSATEWTPSSAPSASSAYRGENATGQAPALRTEGAAFMFPSATSQSDSMQLPVTRAATPVAPPVAVQITTLRNMLAHVKIHAPPTQIFRIPANTPSARHSAPVHSAMAARLTPPVQTPLVTATPAALAIALKPAVLAPATGLASATLYPRLQVVTRPLAQQPLVGTLVVMRLIALGHLVVRYLGKQGVLALGVTLVLGLMLSPVLLDRKRWPKEQATRTVAVVRNPQRFALPMLVWYALRVCSVGIALGIATVLFVRPTIGLFLFWRVFIPCLPLLFFVAPGLWRNLCPMAALNQAPRLFQFTRALTLPKWMQEYGYVISISLFMLFVSSRKVIFNQNGPALALLMLSALAGAFVMGNFFKGKSGWCSSICPLLPIQRVYGQTPFVNIANNHCQPCVGCTKNCYDLKPRDAYLADLYDSDRHFVAYRKFFVGLFPGFIGAFYLLPNPPAIPIWLMYAGFAFCSLVSLGLFFLIEAFAKVTSNKITVLFGALALNLYYWFNAPTLGSLIAPSPPNWFVWPLRLFVFGLTLVWIYRTYQKEAQFIELTFAPQTIHSHKSDFVARQLASAVTSTKPEVIVEPAGQRIPVEKNRTLLEIAESQNLPLEAGCRMGLCGADPVCVLEGMDSLSKMGAEERTTLERLGLAANTRLACMARVQGQVKINLKPAQPAIHRSSVVNGFKYDKNVARIVIVGNGIAGVTAADHIRRRHPHCEIHLVGRERHHLYNRMGITRLIYGRSAMQGLYLLPDKWYDDFNITCWLNTHVTQIDPQARTVQLGVGETLPYDRLILTTGSQSYVPLIEGYGLPGTFVLREAEDAMAIRAYVQTQRCHHAVVAGGGLLGLEAAYGLHKLGLDVTVLERSDALLRRQLDARSGEFLRDYLASLGIHVVMEAEVASVQAGAGEPGQLQQATLKDGRNLPCDLLLVTAGIRSELELARMGGLTINQGVMVDDSMRTSDPAIFAAGDVAEFEGKVVGLWPVAVSQAEVAATNAVAAAGAPVATYVETPPVTMLKVVGIDVTSIGRIEPQSTQERVIVFEDSREHRYRKLVLADGKLVGAILLGYPLEAPGVAVAVKQQIDVTPYLPALQAGDWEVLRALASE